MRVLPEEVVYVYCCKMVKPYRLSWRYVAVIQQAGRKRRKKVSLTAQEFKELLAKLEGGGGISGTAND